MLQAGSTNLFFWPSDLTVQLWESCILCVFGPAKPSQKLKSFCQQQGLKAFSCEIMLWRFDALNGRVCHGLNSTTLFLLFFRIIFLIYGLKAAWVASVTKNLKKCIWMWLTTATAIWLWWGCDPAILLSNVSQDSLISNVGQAGWCCQILFLNSNQGSGSWSSDPDCPSEEGEECKVCP